VRLLVEADRLVVGGKAAKEDRYARSLLSTGIVAPSMFTSATL
jgi:hypothetical protein